MAVCVSQRPIKPKISGLPATGNGIFLIISILLTSCGGGGGGGGGSSTPPRLTAPPPTRIGSSEIGNSPGLHLVAAANLYDHGRGGDGVDIAILDSGVDASHSELRNRVTGGGDWQGSTGGILDPNGHGTHVASIAAANRDGQGMQGIAPDSAIVSYRILNTQGVFGANTGNVMVPPIMEDVKRRGISIINNSWASFYEISDVSSSVIEAGLADELRSYRDAAHETGPVLIWAAGNGSDNDVSVRGGLPYYFPELEDNWITVVAVDQYGHEPSYTNRCGLSAAWCITAPGGGDDEENYGIIGAQTGGGYTLKSGTSMAAPLVSGALSLVLEAMPTITPRAAVARLKETATYQGLTTSSGCTINTCSEDDMRNVFGHGLINVAAALQPIGRASILTHEGRRNNVEKSVIAAPSIIGAALKEGLKGAIAVVHDDYDNAMMLTQIKAAVWMPKNVSPNLIQTYEMILPTPSGMFIAPMSTAPRDQRIPAQWIDIPAPSTETWQGWSWSGADDSSRVMMGYGPERKAIHYTHIDHQHQDRVMWYGVGLDQANGFMDGTGQGAYDIDTTESQWLFLGASHHYGSLQTIAEMMVGKTQIKPSSQSLIKDGALEYDAWSLRTSYDVDLFKFTLAVEQPPALRSGYVTLDQPTKISTNAILFTSKDFHLRPTAKEYHQKIGLAYNPNPDLALAIAVAHINNHQHQHNNNGQKMEINFSYKF